MSTQGDEGPDGRVFRNNTYPVLGWALIASPVALIAVSALSGAGPFAVLCAIPLAPVAAAAGWFCYIVPRVVADEDGVTVFNPTQTHRLAWDQIDRFEAKDRLLVYPAGHDAPPVKAWAVQAANIARMTGRVSHADNVAADLNALLAQHTGRPAPIAPTGPQVRLASLQLAAVAVAAALLIYLRIHFRR
jgi:hypothetical protein